MLSFDRHRDILRLLDANESAGVASLARVLGVSVSTIRRDLDDLAAAGTVRRVRGGAVRVDAASGDGGGPEPVASERALTCAAEKRRIATVAAGLISPGSAIFVSGGTTTERLVPLLEGIPSLVVITNAVNVAYRLGRVTSAEIIVLGGYLRHSELTLLGTMAEQAVREFSVDVAFYSCFGIDAAWGMSGSSLQEASMDREVIATADRLVVLADHTKFARRGPVRLADIERISTLVTDDAAPADEVDRLAAMGVDVRRA
jgi:DeoR family transcriptional regulator of aga operon